MSRMSATRSGDAGGTVGGGGVGAGGSAAGGSVEASSSGAGVAMDSAFHVHGTTKAPPKRGFRGAAYLLPKFLKRWLNFSTRPAESMMRCLPV